VNLNELWQTKATNKKLQTESAIAKRRMRKRMRRRRKKE